MVPGGFLRVRLEVLPIFSEDDFGCESDSERMSRGRTCMEGKGSRIEQEKFTDVISTQVTSQPLFCEEYWSMSG